MSRPARVAGLVVAVAALASGLLAQGDLAQRIAELESDQARVRNAAFNQLRRARNAETLAALVRAVGDLGLQGQIQVARLLAQYPGDDLQPAARRLLGAERMFLRAAAAHWMAAYDGELAMRRCAAALVQMPRDERAAALDLVNRIYHRAVWDAYLGWVDTGLDAGLAQQLLQRLSSWPQRDVARLGAAARELLAAQTVELQLVGAAWLVDTDPAAAELLHTLLAERRDRYWQIHDLLQQVGRIPGPVRVIMAEVLTGANNEHQLRRVGQLLLRHSRDEALAALREVARGEKEKLRLEAVKLLAAEPGGLNHSMLIRLQHEGSVEERILAIDTLRRRDDRSGLPALLELLPGAGKHRGVAVQALARFRDRRAVPVLLDLLDDRDGNVRNHAWRGLQSVMQSLYPFRRFDFPSATYDPRAANRAAGIAELRAWWSAAAR